MAEFLLNEFLLKFERAVSFLAICGYAAAFLTSSIYFAALLLVVAAYLFVFYRAGCCFFTLVVIFLLYFLLVAADVSFYEFGFCITFSAWIRLACSISCFNSCL